MDLMKTILKYAVRFRKIYRKRFAATEIASIVKDMMGSDCLSTLKGPPSHQYSPASTILLEPRNVPALMKSLTCYDAGSKSLSISLIDIVGL